MACHMVHVHPQTVRTALYRVFIQPALTDLRWQSSRPSLLRSPISAQQTRQKTTKKQKQRAQQEEGSNAEALVPGKRSYKDRVAERYSDPRRGMSFGRPPPIIKGAPERPPYDDEIKSLYVNFVDRNGAFQHRVPKFNIMINIDAANEHLVQVAAPKRERTLEEPEVGSEVGNAYDASIPLEWQISPTTPPEPSKPEKHNVKKQPELQIDHTIPTCKIFTKQELRDRAKRTEESAKEKAKLMKSAKVIEMQTVIAHGDLEMKCKQLRSFLEEGRRVDVFVMPPKRRRDRKEPPKTDIGSILFRVQKEVEDIEGAERLTPSETAEEGVVAMTFQKRRL